MNSETLLVPSMWNEDIQALICNLEERDNQDKTGKFSDHPRAETSVLMLIILENQNRLLQFNCFHVNLDAKTL
jgi:hypothetical protein